MTQQGTGTVEVRLDMECAIAVEQMAITENCSVSDILRAAISERWEAHISAERRRRENALRDAPRNRDGNVMRVPDRRRRAGTMLPERFPELYPGKTRGGR